jgi:hypothetical protein
MHVAKWRNSLAIRLPAPVAEALQPSICSSNAPYCLVQAKAVIRHR